MLLALGKTSFSFLYFLLGWGLAWTLRIKSYLPSRKIFLSGMTSQHFFWALSNNTHVYIWQKQFSFFLQSNDLRNVAAEGLAKLLLAGRVLSAKLFVRLLLLWYNPTTEDDVNLRHCLGVFFQVFAFSSRYVWLHHQPLALFFNFGYNPQFYSYSSW